MELVVKTFEQLTLLELYHILQARERIFIVEQECAYLDADGVDEHSTHVFYKENEEICAYTRLYWEEHREKSIKIGRVIAVKRGTGLGLRVMKEAMLVAEQVYHPDELFIHAQSYAIGFYEKAGFSVCSEEFMEDEIPHVEMVYLCPKEQRG